MSTLSRHRTTIFFSIIILVLSGTFLTIKYAQGYRLDLIKKTIKPTGLLVATSNPNGAQVLLNNKLKTATDNTLALEPSEYLVKIKKDGFYDWEKQLLIQKELVTQTYAFLFPKIPDFKPLTFSQVNNPKISPDGTKITYSVPLPNTDAGLWVLDLIDSPFGFSKQPRQIAKSQAFWDFDKAATSWSPDSRELLVEFSASGKYLLSPDQLNTTASLKNIAGEINLTVQRWQKEEKAIYQAKISHIPPLLQSLLASTSASLFFSPDNSRIAYVATASAQIPTIIPPVIAASTQKETRLINPNRLYVYDIKEDKNFEISNYELRTTNNGQKTTEKKSKNSPPPVVHNSLFIIPQWFPTSRHLVWIKDNKIVACEYDNTNFTTMYTGPLTPPYLFITPGTNRLLILAQIDFEFNPKPNLYEIILR